MISGSQVSIFHPFQLIEAILMCMESSILIRFGSSCIVIIVIIIIITSDCIFKKCIYLCIFVLHEGMMFLIWRSSTPLCVRLTWVRVSLRAINSDSKNSDMFFLLLLLLLRLLSLLWLFCTAWDIRIERLSSAQGPLCTVQLFGAWPHQVQWRAAGLLQPVPCETTLRQSPIGPRYDLASRYSSWQWCIRGHARFSLVRTDFAPFLCLRTNRHRIQIVWLCSRVDAGNIWRSWEW